MVRMSQDWKLREVLIEMHGNNGSMDGDPPAAMRYTEARLSKLSGEMLADIEKKQSISCGILMIQKRTNSPSSSIPKPSRQWIDRYICWICNRNPDS